VMIVIMLVLMRISGVSLIFAQAVQNVLHIFHHNINMKTQQSGGEYTHHLSRPTLSSDLRTSHWSFLSWPWDPDP